MKVYILVANDGGEPTFDMPVTYGRGIRAYNSERRAKVYARKFGCAVVELDVTKGKLVYNKETNESNTDKK